ncbi:MAG TPA: PmoA family protein [bacterium]|nr:PmoA family protein [bacterium]HPN42854.1 PmoA family protein [bacterium]
MLKKTSLLIITLLIVTVVSAADYPLKIKVSAGAYERHNTPVCLPLDYLPAPGDDKTFILVELSGKNRIPTPCQVEAGYNSKLWWILSGVTPAGKTRMYELALADSVVAPAAVQVSMDDAVILVHRGDQKVLQYNHAVVNPPAGIDPLFKRSGFIHPLWSPSGAVLTRIQAPDHYHHYGIWNPWTKTKFEGRSVDFWNLGEGQGAVQFAGVQSLVSGPVYGQFRVLQEHIDFSAQGPDKTALHEVWDVRVWNISGTETPVWLWDFTSILNCASSPVELEAYRYGGGIGFRATQDWGRDNSRILTSEGKTIADADGSGARWCDVSGASAAGQRSGIVFMSHPANRAHPEPMRVWPADMNGGIGNVYFEFCPIRHKSWYLLPGNDYVLKYRLLVYDGEMSPAVAESTWKNFAYPPVVEIIH